MPFFNRRESEELDAHIEGSYLDPDDADDVTNYLSDILDSQKRVEELVNEMVNQGDKQVEFLSRLLTLFESLARESRNAPEM